MEFAREKDNAFDRWLTALRVQSMAQLREVVLIEEFKNCVPESVATHLNDQRVTTLAQAAVCAEKFTLTHKTVFIRHAPSQSSSPKRSWRNSKPNRPASPTTETRECFYCQESGHLIAVCPVLQRKKSVS